TNQIDLAIANAENAAGGFGITPAIAEDLFALGLDVLTSGNHVWDKRELYDYLDRQPRLLRPANYPEGPGHGLVTVKARNGAECAVLNLQGRTYMPATDCPFRKADFLLSQIHPAVTVRFVDFHAEATSEKMALGWYLDGRVSAVVARRLAEYDIGQTVVIAEVACVTVEAMEGTDATIERAGLLMRSVDLELD